MFKDEVVEQFAPSYCVWPRWRFVGRIRPQGSAAAATIRVSKTTSTEMPSAAWMSAATMSSRPAFCPCLDSSRRRIRQLIKNRMRPLPLLALLAVTSGTGSRRGILILERVSGSKGAATSCCGRGLATLVSLPAACFVARANQIRLNHVPRELAVLVS